MLVGNVRATSLAELRAVKDLTPERLIREFADFTYELGEPVQDAERFLQRKRGDCDDFAKLASALLTERGYRTKLVVIMMERQTHVVCYVKEAGGFLDFNHRAEARPIIACDGSLEDIAQKVARDFRSPWRMASEIRYEKEAPVYVDNAFPGPFAAASAKTAKQGPIGNTPPEATKASALSVPVVLGVK